MAATVPAINQPVTRDPTGPGRAARRSRPGLLIALLALGGSVLVFTPLTLVSLRQEALSVGGGPAVTVELVATGYEQSLPYYENVLMVGVSQMPLGDDVYTLLDVGDSNVAGAMAPRDPETPSHWLVYFKASDLGAAVARLEQLGGSVLSQPMSAAGVGEWAVVADPFGGAFALLQPETRED